MIIEKKFLFFRSIRILYEDEDVSLLLKKERYDYAAVVSYEPVVLPVGFRLKRKKVANIRLKGSMEEIFGRFSVSTRNEIHKTRKIDGLEFKVADDDIAGSYDLYRRFEKAQGRSPWSVDTYKNTILFNAYYKGEIIVSIPCYNLRPYLQVRSISSKRLEENDKEMKKMIGYAGRRLIYEICRYGKERRYEFAGLGAVNYSTSQKAGVSDFKIFFAPEIADEYTYTYESAIFRRLKTLLPIKNLILGAVAFLRIK